MCPPHLLRMKDPVDKNSRPDGAQTLKLRFECVQ